MLLLVFFAGILCHGEPGCGKTTFVKALLQYTHRHAIVVSINGFTNLEVLDKIMNSDTIANCPLPQDQRIYILEDIDAIGDLVKRRDWKENGKDDEPDTTAATALSLMLPKTKPKQDLQGNRKKRLGKLDEEAEDMSEEDLAKLLLEGKHGTQHLSYLLNILDGVVEVPGRIIVMTTNFVDSLDPALTRPGRIDLAMEFKRCTRTMICIMLSHFYEVPLEDIVLPEVIIDRALTPAQVSQICRGAKHSLFAAIDALVLAMTENGVDRDERRVHDSDEFPGSKKERWTPEPICTDPDLACFNCKMIRGVASSERDDGERHIEVNVEHHF